MTPTTDPQTTPPRPPRTSAEGTALEPEAPLDVLREAATALVKFLPTYSEGAMPHGPFIDAADALRAALTWSELPSSVAEAVGLTWSASEAEAVARAYAAGHRDGVECGIASAGFGFVECEHVGRLVALGGHDDTPD